MASDILLDTATQWFAIETVQRQNLECHYQDISGHSAVSLPSFIAILHLPRVCDAASRCEGTAVLVLYLSLRSRTRLCAWMVQKETYDIIPNICMHIHA